MEASEQDYHNFSSSSSHRLPTVTGTQAIRSAKKNAKPITTSLPQLDSVLGQASSFRLSPDGGVQRGAVTEIFGPPGCGKTTFAIQLAVNALHTLDNETSVTWIDTSSQLVRSRLQQLTEAYRPPQGIGIPSSPPQPRGSPNAILTERFNQLHITTLPRLLALFLSPCPGFPLHNTGLIVLDDLSNLILYSLPRAAQSAASKTPSKTPSSIQDIALAKRATSRRFQVLSSFASSLQKFAATHNVAIVVTSKATVSFRGDQRAVLRPALTSQQWDNSLSTRIALFRDFWPDEDRTFDGDAATNKRKTPTEFEKRSLRFARILKLGGKLVSSPAVGFVIEEAGLREISISAATQTAAVLPLSTQPLHPLEDELESRVVETEILADPIEAPMEKTDQETSAAEDAPVTSPEKPGKTKRKAIEIADSDEEIERDIITSSDDDDDEGEPRATGQDAAPLLPPTVDPEGPQTAHEVAFSTVKRVRKDDLALEEYEEGSKPGQLRTMGHKAEHGDDDPDEMLLESYEETSR